MDAVRRHLLRRAVAHGSKLGGQRALGGVRRCGHAPSAARRSGTSLAATRQHRPAVWRVSRGSNSSSSVAPGVTCGVQERTLPVPSVRAFHASPQATASEQAWATAPPGVSRAAAGAGAVPGTAQEEVPQSVKRREATVRRAARDLNREIVACQNTADIVAVVRKAVAADAAMAEELRLPAGTSLRPRVANVHNLCTAVYHVVRIAQERGRGQRGTSGKQVLERVANDSGFQWLLKHVDRELAEAATRLYQGNDALSATRARAEQLEPPPQPRSLASIAWAVAMLDPHLNRDTLLRFFKPLCVCAFAMLPVFAQRDMGQLVWALAKAQVLAPGIIDRVAIAAERSASEFRLGDASQLLFGLAAAPHRPAGRGAASDRDGGSDAASGEPESVEEAVFGGSVSERALEAAFTSFAETLPMALASEACFPGAFVQILNSYATVSPPCAPDLVQVFLEDAVEDGHLAKFSASQLVRVLQVGSSVGAFVPRVFAVAAELLVPGAAMGSVTPMESRARLAHLSLADLRSLVISCVGQAYRSPPLLRAIVEELSVATAAPSVAAFQTTTVIVRELAQVGWIEDVDDLLVAMLRRMHVPKGASSPSLVSLAHLMSRCSFDAPALMTQVADRAMAAYERGGMKPAGLVAIAWEMACLGQVDHPIAAAAMLVDSTGVTLRVKRMMYQLHLSLKYSLPEAMRADTSADTGQGADSKVEAGRVALQTAEERFYRSLLESLRAEEPLLQSGVTVGELIPDGYLLPLCINEHNIAFDFVGYTASHGKRPAPTPTLQMRRSHVEAAGWTVVPIQYTTYVSAAAASTYSSAGGTDAERGAPSGPTRADVLNGAIEAALAARAAGVESSA